MLTEKFKQSSCKGESREALPRGGEVRSSCEVPDKGMEPRDLSYEGGQDRSTPQGNESTCSSRLKPFDIPKIWVSEAWKRVKKNQGAAGIDNVSIADFERKLAMNLYKVWNRMSSGSYLPSAVKTVLIPKAGGGERKLGVPTVGDRVAQMVVKMQLEPRLDPLFHEDSYGYRPNKSAKDAVGRARKRCWEYDWVLDLDIKGFFDNIPHDLMLQVVAPHAPEKWVKLYVERWLKAPAQDEQGQLTARDKGTPQGGVISPLLANLYLHEAFDLWMQELFPNNPFERYADDAIVHCQTKGEAERILQALIERLKAYGLELNLQKTKIVYCKDNNRGGTHEHEKFTFLGYEFRPRWAKDRKGRSFVSFLPAISEKATHKIWETIRSWKIHLHSEQIMEEMAERYNPVVRGWVAYYGEYYRSALYTVFRPLDRALTRWLCRKHKKLRRKPAQACLRLQQTIKRCPALWAHWQIAVRPLGKGP